MVGGLTGLVVATAAAEDGSLAALLPIPSGTLLSRLCGQLEQEGAGAVTVLTRPGWVPAVSAAVPGCRVVAVSSMSSALEAVAASAAESDGALVLASGEVLTHDSVLVGLLTDPRIGTGVVESRQLPGDEAALELLSERGRIVAAQSPYHPTERTSGFLLGVLKVAAADRGALVAVAAQLADQCRHGPPPAEVAAGLEPETTTPTQAAAMADDVVALVLHGLVEGGTAVSGTELRGLSWARPLSARRAEEAARQMLATDEDRILLDAAVKASDGFFTTFFVSPYSKYIARWCARRGVTPNQVTTFSMVLGALAALAFAAGTRTGLVAGAVALQLAFTFDCVDGQLARYTRQFSTLGAWLDSVFDRTKEYAVYAGLAVGAVRSDGDGGIWLLAAAALTLQVVRHAADFSFAEVRESTARRSASTTDEPGPHVDLEGHLHEGDAATPPRPARTSRLSGLGRAAVVASGYSEEQAWMKWSKRVLVFPIGERFALISVTAALLGPRATFVALLTWGGVAASYGLAGRTLRSVL